MEINQLVNTAIYAAIHAGEKIAEVYASDDFIIVEKQDFTPLTIADRWAHEVILKHLASSTLPVLSEEGVHFPYSERSLWKTYWLVDPLDGTKEFINRNGEFTVNIALISDGQPIAGVIYCPVTGELYVGMEGKGAWKMVNPGDNFTVEQLWSKGVKLPVEGNRSTYSVAVSRTHLDEQTSEFIENLKMEHPSLEIIQKGSSLKFCLLAEGMVDIYPRFAPTMEWDTAAGHALVKATGKKMMTTDLKREITYNKENLTNPHFIVL